MTISFIGSGNVATHLALAMYNRLHIVEQICSRNLQHSKLLADRVEAEPIDNVAQLRKADIYILAVSDDALFDIVHDLHLGNAIVLHTSGATSINVLKNTSTRYGVLWSPQTFVRDVALEYNELPFCIEGNTPETEDSIAEFINMITPHIYRTTQQQRQYLHLAAVMVNNFTNGMTAMAQQLCREHDVPFEVLHPLVLTTAKRVLYGDVRYQLTGPATRHDTKTLSAHRKLLAGHPEILKVYNEFTRIVQNLKESLPTQ